MKKYIVSILVASVFLISAPLAINQASATDLNIRDFINLLVAIGVITPDKMPMVNAYLALQNNTSISTSSVSNSIACTKDIKQCSDGSYVGRTGTGCEFKCAVNIPVITSSSTTSFVAKDCSSYDFNCDGKTNSADLDVIAKYWQNGTQVTMNVVTGAKCNNLVNFLAPYWQQNLNGGQVAVNDITLAGKEINSCVYPAVTVPKN